MSERQQLRPLAQAMTGDAEALSLLWREHRRWVAAILLAHLPGGVDLEDLLQDVAVAFLSQLPKLRDPTAFRPWLRAVAANTARTAGRRRAVQNRVLEPHGLGELDPVDPRPARQRQHDDAQERLDTALAVLQRLPADYQEPMWLRAVQGLSQQQIADTLGLPVTTIETRLARGRRMLRQALHGAGELPAPRAPAGHGPIA